MVSTVEPVPGDVTLSTEPWVHAPELTRQKKTWAGYCGRLVALQNPVPWTVTVSPPVTVPAVVPALPVTVGVTGV